jgi:hypothetical protein
LLSSNLVGLIYGCLDDLLLLGAQRFGQILVELGLLLLKNCEVLLVIYLRELCSIDVETYGKVRA